jgi:CubicO group peptidase (beta-lactamase class C family)
MESEEISEFLRERVEAGDFPSAVYLAAQKGEIVLEGAIGNSVVEPEMIPARLDTIYDLASMTKPLITGLLVAKLIEKHEIGLDDTVSKYFSEFDTVEKRGITIQNLLTHTSGLPAWRPFYLIQNSLGNVDEFASTHVRASALRHTLVTTIAGLPLENPPGTKVVYSDPNFLVLTLLVEKLHGRRLDEIASGEIFAPLGLKETFFNPLSRLRRRIAASEKGNEFEKQTCIEQGYDISGYGWREYRIWGEVHDGNAWAMGGVAGHAGLFSTASETFRIAQQFLPEYTQLLEAETCKLFSTTLTPGLSESRSIAFQTAAVTRDSAGEELPDEAFGHLGFTGTSLWIDPLNERVYILLTNRTHARALPFQILNSVRRRFHDLASRSLDKSSGN